MELSEIAPQAVEAAQAAGAGDAEAFAQDSTGVEIRIFDGEVESLTEAGERGLGVRAWIEGRAGYAYGTDLSDAGIGEVAAAAVEAARVSDDDEFAAAPKPGDAAPPEIPGLADPELAAWTTERKVELAQEVERAARAADERVEAVETTVYVDSSERVALASSRGVSGGFEATVCYAYLQAIAAADGDRQTGMGFGHGRSPAALDPAAIGAEGADRAVRLLGAAKPKSRTCPVVLDPIVAASFAGFIGGTLCADNVQRGRSPFAGRLGDEVASAALTLTDDATDPGGLATSPLDGEGTPRAPVALIESGRLATYLHDSYTARREQAAGAAGARSTASASRSGYRSPPSVSTSNLIVAPGEKSLGLLLAEAGEGMYVAEVSGLHSGVNPVSGTFSVGATGINIEGGQLAAPADEFTIASDLVSMLQAIAATGRDARWVPFGGSVNTPPILISEMAVAGA